MSGYLIGISIGVIVAVIISVILHLTVFKDKKMWALYLVLIILFAFVGWYVYSSYFVKSTTGAPDPGEQITDLATDISDNWGNTNGGFTIEQITTSQADECCPTIDDVILDLTAHDFGAYVVFSYKLGDEYENVLFYKSNNGLLLDGKLNLNCKTDQSSFIVSWQNLDTFRWVNDFDPGVYYATKNPIMVIGYDNLVSLSRQSNLFHAGMSDLTVNLEEIKYYDLKQAVLLTSENVLSHFVKFNNVEMISNAENAFRAINTFYNYLYEQIKGKAYNTVNVVDATNSWCVPIPTAEQENYPIPEDKRAEYDNAEYYGVYNCDIAFNVSYVKGNKELARTTNNEDYIADIESDTETGSMIEVDTIEPNYNFTKLNINFEKKNENTSIANVDLTTTPVIINFTCEELDITKKVTLDNISKFDNGAEVLLASNKSWKYEIQSENILFNNLSGSFSIGSTTSEITLVYDYLADCIVAQIGLNPIGDIDMSVLDLANNPVKIILSNETKSYEFVFDSNDKLNTKLPMLVELGTYTYTILSEQLVFASNTGTLIISTADNIHLFNCAMTSTEDNALNCDVGVYRYKFNSSEVQDCFDISLVYSEFIEEVNNNVFDVGVNIYDESGVRIVAKFSLDQNLSFFGYPVDVLECLDSDNNNWVAVDGENFVKSTGFVFSISSDCCNYKVQFLFYDDNGSIYSTPIVDISTELGYSYAIEFTALPLLLKAL